MVRIMAVDILTEVETEKAYSNLLLNEYIRNNDLSQKDIGLLTSIVYGTLQKGRLIDFYLEPFLEGKKIKLWGKNIFRTAVYQLVFLDKVPPHAIVNEAVGIAKKKYGRQMGQFVNAILRRFIDTPLRSLDEVTDEMERLSIETSHPLWMIKMWTKQYDFDTARKICVENIRPPKRSARVNTHLTSVDAILSDEITRSEVVEDGVLFDKGNIADTDLFRTGKVTIQDESSMLVARTLDPKEGEKILDMCAAPGGKTTHIASLMNNTGRVYAHDLYDHKISLVKASAKRQKLTNIKASVCDGLNLPDIYKKESFDRIILDAPCSGLGVIKRKPDILLHKVEQDMDAIVKIQASLLDVASGLIKKDGTLVYSTCTINKKENEKQIEKFLKNHSEFKLISEQLIMPFEHGSDGFYIAKLKKTV